MSREKAIATNYMERGKRQKVHQQRVKKKILPRFYELFWDSNPGPQDMTN